MEKYLSPLEVTEYFTGKISEGTLANWRTQGKGPKYKKLGGKVVYSLSDLQAWEKEQTK